MTLKTVPTLERGERVRFLWPYPGGDFLIFQGVIEFVSFENLERKVEIRKDGLLFAVPREHVILADDCSGLTNPDSKLTS
jgi:hypothetical protein